MNERSAPRLQPESDGRVTCTSSLFATDTQLRLEVTDPEGAAAVASISLVVEETQAPEIEIISPSMNGSYYSDIPIFFSALISDAEDSPNSLQYLWTSSLDGELEGNANPQEDGTTDNYIILSEGVHNISLYVEDTSGKNNTQTIPITVKPPNQTPECTITAPESDISYLVGQNIEFSGTVTDHEDDNTELSISWTSSIDGILNTLPPQSNGSILFATNSLSPGNHTITLTAEDETEETCNASIQLSVGTHPAIIWNEPTDLSVHSVDTAITFLATVTDQEDSPLDLSIEWSSDLDGVFSTSGADNAGLIEFEHSNLQAGLHQITVTATDSMGFADTHSRAVRINTPPETASVSIEPILLTTNEDLTAIVPLPNDADGDTVTISYEWIKDGIATNLTSETIPHTQTTAGEEWTVIVTPNDGYIDGIVSQASATIENTPPLLWISNFRKHLHTMMLS